MIAIRPRDPEDRRITVTATQDADHLLAHDLRHPRPDPACRRPHLVAEALGCAADARSSFCSSSLVAFGAYLYFVEGSAIRRRQTPERSARRSSPSKPDKIEEITVKSDSGDRTTLKKTAATGRSSRRPTGAAADGRRGLRHHDQPLDARAAARDRRERAGPRRVRPRGAAHRGAFKAGGQQQTLQIGAKTPTGNDLYAKIAGQAKVFLIPSYLESTFNRKDVRPARQDGAEDRCARRWIRWRSLTEGRTRQVRKGERSLAAHLAAGTEQRRRRHRQLVSRLAEAQMKSMAPGSDLKEYGLDKPAATVRIGTGSSQATLSSARRRKRALSTRRTNHGRPSSRSNRASLDDLKKGPAEYPAEGPLRRTGFNTTRIEITRGGRQIRLREEDGEGQGRQGHREMAADLTGGERCRRRQD